MKLAMRLQEPADPSVGDKTTPEEAARKRAQIAREALRRTQLVGEPIPNQWLRGKHYNDGDRNSNFGPGELVVFKEHFAVVQMCDEQGMLVVEAGHGEAPGSRGMRNLGPAVLGKITEDGHRDLNQA